MLRSAFSGLLLAPRGLGRMSSVRSYAVLYTKSHEWLDMQGDKATLGITDHAQKELGDIVFVEGSDPADEVEIGDDAGQVESVKASSAIVSPVTGTVLEFNRELENSPGLLNSEPMGKGWLLKFHQISSVADDLMTEEEYKKFLE